ncbi:MAG: hypothetical protein KBH99_04690 [Syntrophobacteraceae bacterium]|nr:hypothetical protein [Syntrophobacteraceae bacterium]
MIVPGLLSRVTAEAVTPEQVLPFACTVSDSRARMIGDCVGLESGGDLVLVGYPLHDPLDTKAMNEAVDQALRIPNLERLTVIGPAQPGAAPEKSVVEEDCYYALPLPPPPPGQKLRNLLRRAARELKIERNSSWGEHHAALVQSYLDGRYLGTGTRWIFRRLPRYLAASSGSLLLSARLPDGCLAGFAVGEYSSLHTAFFMFSFRDPLSAPPGTADLLLFELLKEGHLRGQVRMNLGLGVNQGIRFFKRKWGAVSFLPCVQVSWKPGTSGFLSRLRVLIGK